MLISAARNANEADEVAALGASLAGSIQAVQADVTVAGDAERLIERALEVRGRIDVLVRRAIVGGA